MKNEPGTLLIVTPGFAANESDSTCLPAHQRIVKALKNSHGSNIIVLALHYPYSKIPYQWQNVEVIPLGGKNRGKLMRLMLWLRFNKVLKKVIRDHKVTGILSFWCEEAALLGKRAGKKYGIRHYCWIRGQDAKKSNRYIKYIRPGANELIALSDSLQNEFEKNHGVKPFRVITPGIDPKEYTSTIEKKEIDILGVGSLIPLKQFDLFLEIVAALKPTFPGLKVVICGQGVEEHRLRNQIGELGLQDTVTLTGEIPHPDLLGYMQKSKLLLHASFYEGFSGVCLEALYAGAHVISFTRAMNQEIPHWHIVKTRDEMLSKASQLLGDPQLDHSSILFSHINEEVTKVKALYGF